MNFIAIIPSRFAACRFPGKPLADINGKPMVVRVMEQAQASGADRVIVATDHQSIAETVERAGGEVCLTRLDHQSGTERIYEVVERYHFSNDQIIVNVQGDEPFIIPKIIHQIARDVDRNKADMVTLASPITTKEEAYNPNVVKVVINSKNHALYFSRAYIPWRRERFYPEREHFSYNLLRHIGLYGYRAAFLRQYISWSTSPLENIELLEQLRVLWHGEKIYVTVINNIPNSNIDTPEDLEKFSCYDQNVGVALP
ncbi:3-deoxy-D-manno-octulosonate cytidylyltransferase [secondary endosymbiont of Heteropsylla cubana]|uniref:3-deoxy-manno-octulosonate cytidylyltransferase n=1 Tax=secondary endosymbiont of Heteropsylla cubana TaxID=134287 RepID=J3YSX3_9ENTR|nr:3-deoxy-manno-octulosonate cytidylyltransferase [secondary endosymbiont of Heteropsylla cubana]AFP85433.1 3-deoxy-D-manno-octulosonate cytidylyltransferase [secondary endosymbiont of Heteropsylla cubana]